jgi:hypothetical protein
MTPRVYLMFTLLIAMVGTGCRRSSQTWSSCTHDKPLIEIRLLSRPTDSCPRTTSTHILRLEDTFANASLDIRDSYLNETGDSTFSTSRSKGSVVATYYCEEIDVDHRLVLEFVCVPKGIAVRRAAYFFHVHCPPEPAWDCDCNAPRKISYFDDLVGPMIGPNLTLEFNAKSQSHQDPLRMEMTIPLRAIPPSVRRAAHLGAS